MQWFKICSGTNQTQALHDVATPPTVAMAADLLLLFVNTSEVTLCFLQFEHLLLQARLRGCHWRREEQVRFGMASGHAGLSSFAVCAGMSWHGAFQLCDCYRKPCLPGSTDEQGAASWPDTIAGCSRKRTNCSRRFLARGCADIADKDQKDCDALVPLGKAYSGTDDRSKPSSTGRAFCEEVSVAHLGACFHFCFMRRN